VVAWQQRRGTLWLGGAAAALLGFWSLDALAGTAPGMVGWLGAILGLGFVALGFVAGERRTRHRLGEANARLRREAAHVRLLEYAAVAANEASTLDEAMRDGVKRICMAMNWPVGHIYAVEAEGTLQATGVFLVRDDENVSSLLDRALDVTLPIVDSLPERALASGRPEGLYDLAANPDQPGAGLTRRLHLQTAYAVPVMTHGRVAAVLEFGLRERMEPDRRVLDVLALVGIQIGRVAERMAVQQRFRQAQKMQAIGRLSAGVANEINNPMAFVRANLNQLFSEWKRLRSWLETLEGSASALHSLEDCQEILEETIEGVERTVSIAQDMKKFAHSGDESREPNDLREIIETALRMASSHAPPGVTIRRCHDPELPFVSCSPNQMNQVLVNLVMNAIEAASPTGYVDVETCLENESAVIQIEDTGPGMTAETRERIFDPFFTTKQAGEGTGLGLAISYEIVRNHGGEIRVISAVGAGTVVEVRLPLV